MAKGYWIGHVTVDDPQAYQAYRDANAAVFAEYGAKFLVRGGAQTEVEGQTRPRSVVIEFESVEAAEACYNSDAYQAAKALRDPVASSDLVIVAGYEG